MSPTAEQSPSRPGRRPKQPRECDLVMRGGITSGVVYPSAILELVKRGYTFRSIGGTSVGAIAAAITAAAQYGERRKTGSGFEALGRLTEEITQPRFMQSLFRPAPETRAGFETLLPLVSSHGSRFRRLLGLIGSAFAERLSILSFAAALVGGYAVLAATSWDERIPSAKLAAALALSAIGAFITLVALVVAARLLRRRKLAVGGSVAALLALAGITFDALALASATGSWSARLGLVLSGLSGAVFVFAAGALVSLGLLAFGLLRALEGNFFGMCLGKPGLTQWLHEHIQAASGRPPDKPLTFADLERAEVTLQMVTTDLSYGRPLALPAKPTDVEYLFDLDEWSRFFPEAVIAHLATLPTEDLGPSEPTGRPLRRLPGKDLPIVVAARLSLSYPILLCALPLYSRVSKETGLLAAGPGTDDLVVQHWFSDGGISSNFPIHFFDSWFPGRPTFGLDLQPFPDRELVKRLPETESHPVYMPSSPLEQPLPRWAKVDTIGGFLRQMFDAARNWRDITQSELPGFRDRICHVRLSEGEGGLNLDMDSEVVGALIARGTAAGAAIVDRFSWSQHRYTRYLTWMQMLEVGLAQANEQHRFPAFRRLLEDGGFPYYANGHDRKWRKRAAKATAELLALAETWSDGKHPPRGFDSGHEPEPTPTMRVVPRV